MRRRIHGGKVKLAQRAKTVPGCRSLFLLICILWCSGLPAAFSQTAEETLVFNAASIAYDLGVYDRAEKQFADFIAKYPGSVRVPDAILFQARAALQQKKYKDAVSLLSTNLPRASTFADQYIYWMSEAYRQSTNYLAAAEGFARLIAEYPASPRLLEACYAEVDVRFKLGQFGRVSELLQKPEGAFQREAQARPNDELVVRGYLLLGEALFEQKAYRAAQQVLDKLARFNLSPEYKWHREHLLIRSQVAEKQFEPALAGISNLVALATLSGQGRLQAESVFLQASILEQLNRFDAAIQAYTNNLVETVGPGQRRQALLKIIQLTLKQGRAPEAGQRLESFLSQYPEDSNSDVVLLTLGELYLKQRGTALETNQTNSVIGSPTNNFLVLAGQAFDRLLTNYAQSPLVGQASLGKGWCYWEEGKIRDSQVAFKRASESLPHGEEQALARFKLGDAFLWQKDFTNAIQQYRSVLKDYTEVVRVKETLVEPALYQLLRASVELDDLATASEAMRQLLESHPNGDYAQPGHFLLGQAFMQIRRPADARKVFGEFCQHFPTSSLRPEVEMALARTHIEEKAWDPALGLYESWLQRFPSNALRPSVEFNRAWVTSLAGRESNALVLFTNFVAGYAANYLAPYARFWVADYYYGRNNYTNAEYQYQLVFQTWPNTPLAHLARMMAGRAAFARQNFKSAEDYFTALVNDNAATNLWAEAFFALGDTFLMEDTDPANPTRKFDEAQKAFRRITELYPKDRLVASAWGQIGNCYFQMGSQEAAYYESAIEAYQRVLAPSNHADIRARSQAEVGWAKVLEQQAHLSSKTPGERAELLKSALGHYLNVVEGKLLANDEEADPFWLKEAGFAAAALAEEQKEWDVAQNIYRRLAEQFPPLRALLDKKIDKIREQVNSSKG